MARITKQMVRRQRIEQTKITLMKEMKDEEQAKYLAGKLLDGAENGLEFNSATFGDWLSRFSSHLVWLSREDYTWSLVRALWNSHQFAGSDFGSSRQRDMAQKWTDTARGYLGERAFQYFLKKRFGFEARGDTTRGKVEDYLATDITLVKPPSGDWRAIGVDLSVKATKFNGRWLDVPGGQIQHSDIFVLAKIGVTEDHFMSYLKSSNYFSGKLFPEAIGRGELSEEEAKILSDEIPDFDVIPAYIAGSVDKGTLNLPIHELVFTVTGGKAPKIKVTQGVGVFSPETIRANPLVQVRDPEGKMDIEIEPIIKSLPNVHFLAHSGSLKFLDEDWQGLVRRL